MTRAVLIEEHTLARDFAGELVAELCLTFTTADPAAVRARFGCPGDEADEWMFARELLVDGLAGRAGIGDVVVQADIVRVALVLTGPCDGGEDETQTVFLPRVAVERFLRRAEELVPVDAPLSGFDAELAELLDGAL
jgi:hypothetical protein